MSLRIYNDVEQGSDRRHELRRGVLTASVIGQLITVKTIKPANNDISRGVTAHLVAERITGYTEPTFVTADMQRGNDDEPVARDLYSKHFAPVREVGFMTYTWPDGRVLGFSPDGLVGEHGLIEIKSRRQKKHLTTILADEVPLENMAQIQTGLLVTGREWCDYVSFCGGMPLYVKRVRQDDRWEGAIIDAFGNFEATAAEMIATYNTRTAGAPMTERRIEIEDLVF